VNTGVARAFTALNHSKVCGFITEVTDSGRQEPSGNQGAHPEAPKKAKRKSSPFVPEARPVDWAGKEVGDYQLILEMGRSLTDTTYLARTEGTRSTD
jgi:hypothetical protein